MEYPKISIVTPNYNGGKYLEETILSVLSQNYPNLEYIIIDGGSTDDSIEIIKKYESQLAFWISEPDSGLYEAVQKGFDKSTGEIMAWINSDDMYHRKAFFVVAEIFSCFKEVHWLLGNPSVFDEQGRTTDIITPTKWSKLDYFLWNGSCIQQESTFWRRSLWEKAGSNINASMKYAGDFDLWLRFLRHEKLYNTLALLGGFRQRSSNQLSLDNMDKYIIEAKEKLQEEYNSSYLTENEKKVITKVIKFKKILYYSKIKYLNFILNKISSRYIDRQRKKYFLPAKTICFDRIEQKFKFKKE